MTQVPPVTEDSFDAVLEYSGFEVNHVSEMLNPVRQKTELFGNVICALTLILMQKTFSSLHFGF